MGPLFSCLVKSAGFSQGSQSRIQPVQVYAGVVYQELVLKLAGSLQAVIADSFYSYALPGQGLFHLAAAGYDVNAVQRRVNQLAR